MLRLNRFPARARSALVPASCTDRTLDIGLEIPSGENGGYLVVLKKSADSNRLKSIGSFSIYESMVASA